MENILSFNDFLILSWVEDWAASARDDYLKELSYNFVRRKLFGVYVPPENRREFTEQNNMVKELIGEDKVEYYFLEDELKDMAYKDFMYCITMDKPPEEIRYQDEDNNVQPLSGYDGLLMKAKDALKFDRMYWYMPKDIKEELLRRVNNES